MKKTTPQPFYGILVGAIFLIVYFGSIHPLLKQSLSSSTQNAFAKPAPPPQPAEKEIKAPIVKKTLPSLLSPQKKQVEKRELPKYVKPSPKKDSKQIRFSLRAEGESTEHRNSVFLRYNERPDSLSFVIKVLEYEEDEKLINLGMNLFELIPLVKLEETEPLINAYFSDVDLAQKWGNNYYLEFAPEFPSIAKLESFNNSGDYLFDPFSLPHRTLAINLENTHKRHRVEVEVQVHAWWKNPSGRSTMYLSN